MLNEIINAISILVLPLNRFVFGTRMLLLLSSSTWKRKKHEDRIFHCLTQVFCVCILTSSRSVIFIIVLRTPIWNSQKELDKKDHDCNEQLWPFRDTYWNQPIKPSYFTFALMSIDWLKGYCAKDKVNQLNWINSWWCYNNAYMPKHTINTYSLFSEVGLPQLRFSVTCASKTNDCNKVLSPKEKKVLNIAEKIKIILQK